ncbi:unnamed protein product [Oppiella nova]|uniref:Serpin domain-containing protein n=1 Tax=Oppiella nova TaxID=334625 RepID=A0A7R9LK27_9ACAR|nr:unnamed protein product [Oppiella nova]CAG2164425.1 unnamed protein product [Oppiella nova]
MKEINPKPIALTPKADFSRINREVPQKVTEVIHKTFIAIDEKGTEAAAVTAIKIVPLSAQIHPDPIIFRADHPFLYFIRDKTNGILMNGANNETLKDLKRFLRKDLPLLDTFANTVRQYYRADIQTADFVNNNKEEIEKVNEWVRNQTNHKIEKIFETIENDTSLIIINAIYFKGNWLDSFYKSLTQKLDFYNNGQNGVKVDTMTSRDYLNYLDSNELNAQILELQYTGREISFIVVLPKRRDGLNELKSKINSQNFDKFWLFSYDLMKEINPKPIALTPKADFSQINGNRYQKVAEVIHKTFIAIDEKGTEAAAVTAIKVVVKSAQIYPDPIIFRADHPFIYFIRDQTNVINSNDLPLLDTFANTVRQYYRADIQTADFVNNNREETEKVNEWVRNQTNHKIEKIFDTIKNDTSLIIINAIYFKGL